MKNYTATNQRAPKSRRISPPHAPWVEMQEALRKLKGFRPPKVDASLLKTYSIAPKNEYAVITALKYLGLIDSKGVPTDKLGQLEVEGEGYTKNLSRIVKEAYSGLLERIDLKDATVEMINNYFLTQKVGPSVAPRCTRFFIGIAKEAGIPISPELAVPAQLSERRRSVQPRIALAFAKRKKLQRELSSGRIAKGERVVTPTEERGDRVKLVEAKLKLFEKLPSFDASWKPEAIELVFREFQRLADRLEGKLGEEAEEFSNNETAGK